MANYLVVEDAMQKGDRTRELIGRVTLGRCIGFLPRILSHFLSHGDHIFCLYNLSNMHDGMINIGIIKLGMT